MSKVYVTVKQKRAAEALLVGKGGSISQAMRAADYSSATINTPQKLTESKGFQELCKQMGLTDELIIGSLKEDIEKKPQNRKPELELAARLRRFIDDKDTNVNVNVAVSSLHIDEHEIKDYVAWRNERIHAGFVARSTEEIPSDMGGGQLDEDGERNKT